jgi:hypothetical protein
MNMRPSLRLEKCPCGRIPDHLVIVPGGQGEKYRLAVGSCCGEWHVEFPSHYKDPDECMAFAVQAWNCAARTKASAAVTRLEEQVRELQARLSLAEKLLVGMPVTLHRGNPGRGPESGPGYGRKVKARIIGLVGSRVECELAEDDPNAVGSPCRVGESGAWEASQVSQGW